MAVKDNQDLFKKIERLPAHHQKTVNDFVEFLITRDERPDWDDIDRLEPDDVPLSEEEMAQIRDDDREGFVTGEEAVCEFKIRVPLP